MKATGIVRRIDELGRIVIPKEIRKSHRLNEGDPIEFYLEQGKIILRKQNEMEDYYHQIEIMCDTLQAMTSCKILFIEDTWLQHHELQLEEGFYKKCRIYRMEEFIQNKIYQDDTTKYDGLIYPIVSLGHWRGSFVVIYRDGRIKENQMYALEAFTRLLSKQ